MKYLICLLAVFLTACATTSETVVDPLSKPIRVTGRGSTKDEAKKNGLSEAVGIYSGMVVLSGRESRNEKLVSTSVDTYSAGYVDRYEVIEEMAGGRTALVTMDVWVRPSNMSGHKLNLGKSTADVDGNTVDTQHKTLIAERAAADKMMANIVNDFPSKALEIKQGQLSIDFDGYRNMVITAPYEIKWFPKYLTSLKEALKNVQTGPENFDLGCACFVAKEQVTIIEKTGIFSGSYDHYYLRDAKFARTVKERLQSKPVIKVTVYDINNNVLHTECWKQWTEFGGTTPKNVFEVYGYKTAQGILEIKAPPNSELTKKMKNVNRLELTLVHQSCERQ